MSEEDDICEVCDNLYIGAYWPRFNLNNLKKRGIIAIVNLMEESRYVPPRRQFKYLHKGFPDEYYVPFSFLDEILQFIGENASKGKVLVHCSMGISRSGGIAVAWLLKKNPSWSWSNALEHIKKNRSIYPAAELKKSILDYFESKEGRRRNL